MSDAQARRRPSWGELGDELRRLRRLAGISQKDMAGILGLHRATVERIETGGAYGGSPPDVVVVENWAAATARANPDPGLLRRLAEAAQNEHRPYGKWGNLAAIQQAIRADEAEAATIRNLCLWGVPGLLQVDGYARAVLELTGRESDVSAALAQRVERRSILFDDRRTLEFLVTEEGLLRRPSAVAVQRAQLDQVLSAMSLPSVSLGIIPLTAQMRAAHDGGFVLYEDREDARPFVSIELPHERIEIHAAGEVEFYQRRFALLREEAVSGDEAAGLIRRAMASLTLP